MSIEIIQGAAHARRSGHRSRNCTPLLGGHVARHSSMRLNIGLLCLLITAFPAAQIRAGGSGLNVIVVVNQNSPNSVQLGNDYCQQRGVPPQNVFRMTGWSNGCLLYTSPSPRDGLLSRMPS